MKNLRTYLLTTAAVAALSGSAFAADMGLPMKAPPAPAPIPYTGWQGWYLGGAIGAARLNTTAATTDNFAGGGSGSVWPCGDFSTNTLGCSTGTTGFTAGVQAGYDWQSRYFVYGVVADWTWTGLKHSINRTAANGSSFAAFQAKVDWLATFRGRMGLAVDDTLVYFTGGLALAQLKSSASAGFDVGLGGSSGITWNNSLDKIQAGWVAGLGVEHKLSQNWSVFTEFLYYDLGRTTASGQGTHTGGDSYSTEFTHEIFQGKLGVNYRF
jgi:outer membrane immunogenic protein